MKYDMKSVIHNILYAKRYPLYAVILSTTVENSLQITPFYAKQSQFYSFSARKRRFHKKTNPIQSQFKPKQSQFNPIQTQFKPNRIHRKPSSLRIIWIDFQSKKRYNKGFKSVIWGPKTTEKCSVSGKKSLLDEENDYVEIIF